MLTLPLRVIKSIAKNSRDEDLGFKHSKILKKAIRYFGHNNSSTPHINSSASLTNSTGFIIAISSVFNLSNRLSVVKKTSAFP